MKGRRPATTVAMASETRSMSMRVLVLAVLVLPLALGGCADDGPATFRFKGQLDRGLTPAEQDEVRDVLGEFTVESTDMACPATVDPYDCNATWLRVDDITEARCERGVDRLEARTYWRSLPTCDQPPDDGL